MSKNLLVVDFDYFFINKLEGGIIEDDWQLYDWGHNESTFFREIIWPHRAATFMGNDMPLPYAQIPVNWWDRFNISSDAVVEISDSNAYSGVYDGCESFNHVWLFDAHHDLYRFKTQEQIEKWYEEGQVTCEDWMFAHWMRGSKLHWRYPRWHKRGKSMRNDIPKIVNCDARKDDMGKLDIKFDGVSICRSGCWVPSWCDQQFIDFVYSCPAGEYVEVEDGAMNIREWEEAANLQLHARKKHDEEFKRQLELRAQNA